MILISNNPNSSIEADISQLVNKYANVMLRCAYTYCGNLTDAEDIIQEVFLKYLCKIPQFNNEEHEKAWFIRVTINTSKDYIKSFWRRKTEPINEHMLYKDEADVSIWDMVQKLIPKYRIVILLYYKEGYSIRQIAEILKVKESTIGTQLSRARDMLKEKMIKEDYI